MKKFVFNTLKLSLLIMMYFSSCYNNKEATANDKVKETAEERGYMG